MRCAPGLQVLPECLAWSFRLTPWPNTRDTRIPQAAIPTPGGRRSQAEDFPRRALLLHRGMARALRIMSSKCEPGSHPGLVSVRPSRAVLTDAAKNRSACPIGRPNPLEIE